MLPLIALLLVAGCGDPYVVDTSHQTKTKPKRADLIGTYVPDVTTRELNSKGGYPERTTSIELKADGTIRITNIPDWWRMYYPDKSKGFDSGVGNWKLKKSAHETEWSLKLDFPSMKDFDSDRRNRAVRREGHPEVGLSTGMGLVGETPPYAIDLIITPRHRRALKLKKKWMRFRKVQTVRDN